METQWQNPKTKDNRGQYSQTLCQPQCEIFKDYTRYSELIYTVASLDELEQGVLETIVANLDPGDEICQIVVSPHQQINDPSQAGLSGYMDQQESYEWVLVLTKKNLVLFDATYPNNLPMVRKAPIENLLSITWGRILLQSWMDWSWSAGSIVEHARINFSTSGEKPIEETIRYIHGADLPDAGELYRLMPEQDLTINSLPNKFVDLFPLLLNHQDKIQEVVYYPFQPAVWKSWYGLFRKQERKATPSTAFLLTEQQFIMIYEEDHDAGLGLGTFIQSVNRKNILDLVIESDLDGIQLFLLVGDKNAQERIILHAPEECFVELIEKISSVFSLQISLSRR